MNFPYRHLILITFHFTSQNFSYNKNFFFAYYIACIWKKIGNFFSSSSHFSVFCQGSSLSDIVECNQFKMRLHIVIQSLSTHLTQGERTGIPIFHKLERQCWDEWWICDGGRWCEACSENAGVSYWNGDCGE